VLYIPFLEPTQTSKRGFLVRSGCFQNRRATQVYLGEHGYAKSTLMSSPRLRGLFGANNNGCNKKPIQQRRVNPTNPRFPVPPHRLQHPAYPSPAPRSNHFPRNTNSNSNSPPQLPSLPRRTSPSPVRLGPSLTRFDIGAWSRSPIALLHSSSSSYPKPPPRLPSVVVEELGGAVKMGDTTTHQGSLRKTPIINHRC
jgi:hypothetical protein